MDGTLRRMEPRGGDSDRWDGLVAVVAGAGQVFEDVIQSLVDRGASVARVAPRPDARLALSYLGDPADVQAWERAAPHIEQRHGPIDVVVCDQSSQAAVERVFGPDLRRRGHGGIVLVGTGDDADSALSSIRRLL